jgi:hypothetical protein
MATGAAGKITEYTDPPVINNGTVFTPTAGANIIANINRLIDGNGVTLKALQIDGTGNNAVTVPSGALQVSGIGAPGTSLPTAAPTFGTLFKDFCVAAAVTFNGSAGSISVINPYNIQSAVRNSAGNYTFTLVTTLQQTPLVMTATFTAGFITVNAGLSAFTVNTGNTSNTATDFNAPVHVVMFGR